MQRVTRFVLGAAAVVAGLAWAGTTALEPVGPGSFRWRDINDNLFASTFQGSYAYSQAAVSLVTSDSGAALSGLLVGTGLKPNFAYQLKLEGKPTALWGAAGDDEANERIGYAGRWWMERTEVLTGTVTGANSTDDAYAAMKALGFSDETYTYVFKGYLLFDHFVTTSTGAVPNGSTGWGFEVDSSFHVLWKTSQRARQANDSAPLYYSVRSFRAPYYTSGTAGTVGIYGEWEPGRALPGQLALPAGTYNVRFVLTEESFHSTLTQGGNWAGALAADSLQFTLAPPAPGAISGTVTNKAGKAVASAMVTVTRAGTSVGQTQTGTNGTYAVADLVPATYSVTISASGYRTQTKTATVSAAQTTVLNFTLR